MAISNKNIIQFTIELDKILIEEKHMFCPRLLDILEEFLGIKHSNVIIHRNKSYLQVISHNIPQETDDMYHSTFYQDDLVAKYAKDNWTQLYDNNELLLSSQLMPKESYDESAYVKFLNKAGTHYLLCMLFDEFYLALHKTKDMGDFTKDEMAFYSDIYRLLKHKYNLFKKQKQLTYLYADENDALNQSRIGSLIFDNNNQLIKYNNFAKKYLGSLLPHFEPNTLYVDLCDLIQVEEIGLNQVFDFEINGFFILSRFHYQEDYYKNSHRFLSLILMKQPKQDISPTDIKKFNTLTGRELDVVQSTTMGLQYQEVADELSISINTVRTHLKNIHHKLGINNQRKLVRLFLEYQLYNKHQL